MRTDGKMTLSDKAEKKLEAAMERFRAADKEFDAAFDNLNSIIKDLRFALLAMEYCNVKAELIKRKEAKANDNK